MKYEIHPFHCISSIMATIQRDKLVRTFHRTCDNHRVSSSVRQNLALHEWDTTEYTSLPGAYSEKSGFRAQPVVQCGCPSTKCRVDNSNNTALYSVIRTRPAIDTNQPFFKVLTNEGYREPDACFCVVNSKECKKCEYAQILLEPSSIYARRFPHYECERVSPEDFPEELFDISCFEFEDASSDGEGWPQMNDFIVFCIKYKGPMFHRRIWHLIMPYGDCMICRHTVSAGLLVPEVASHSLNARKQILPRIGGVMIDTRVQISPPSLQRLAYESLPSVRCSDNIALRQLWLGDNIVEKGMVAVPRPIGIEDCPAPRNSMKARRLINAVPRGDVDTSKEGVDLTHTMTQQPAANVELAETTVPSVSVVADKKVHVERFIQDLQPTVDTLGDRWCRFDSFSWSSASTQGTILQRLDMPLTMLQNSNCAPNALLFNQYAYFKTDMEIEYQINTAPGQSGILVVGVMYNATQETAASSRIANAVQLVQMPHMRLNAAGSNSGKMMVPWVFQLPVAPTRNMPYASALYYYTIFVGVLAPLRVGTNGSTTANVVAYGRFKNLQFFGQRNLRDAVPRGLVGDVGSLVGHPEIAAIENKLSKVLGKLDCDKPNNPDEPTNLYLQQNTSLSLATGSNRVKLLQLLHDNTTPHPAHLVPSGDQYSSKFLTSCFGLAGAFQWGTSQGSDQILIDVPVSPLRSWEAGGTTFPTPLAGLSYYYGGYHGDILVRFTFCVSKFHSGRVSIMYIPDDAEVGVGFNSTCYYSSIVDVQDQAVYTFRIPYQVPTLYAPIHTYYREWTLGTDAVIANAPTTVYPSYGILRVSSVTALRANQTASPTIDILYEMCGAENFHFVYPIASQMPVFRTGAVPTSAYVKDLTEEGIEPNPGPNATPRGDDERHKTITEKAPLIDIVPEWFNSLNERFEVRDVAKRYATVFRQQQVASASNITTFEHLTMAQVSVFHMPIVPPINAIPITNPTWEALGGNPIFARTYQIAHERIDLRTNNTISFRVPWTSPMVFLANGYNPTLPRNAVQSYCNGRVHIEIQFNVQDPRQSYPKPQSAVFSFDVTPSTLSERFGIEETDYNLLDFTSWLHDGFRYFRGDLNFQLDFLPFDRSATAGLGWDVSMVISRAMGDNAHFYVFQGFPPVTRTLGNTVNMLASTIVTLSGLNTTETDLKNAYPGTQWERDLTREGIEPNPGPILSKIVSVYDKFVNALESFGFSRDFLNRQVPRLLRFITVSAAAYLSPNIALGVIVEYLHHDFYERIKKAATGVEHTASKIDGMLSFDEDKKFSNIMTLVEVSAAVMNVWNSTTIFQTLINMAVLLNKFKMASIVVSQISSVFEGVTPRADNDENSSSWVSLVIAGILAAIGVKGHYRGDTKEYVASVRDFFKDGVNIKRFVDAHFNFLGKIVSYFKNLFGVGDSEIPRDVSAEMIAWMEEVNHYCEHYNGDEIIENSAVAKKIFDLRNKSIEFDKLFVSTGTHPPNGYYSYKNRLQTFINHLGKGGIAEKVRPTPFCMWMYGDPGIGKSRIADELLTNIGQEFGVVSSNPVYARTTETEYWNNYRQQPLILFPDFAKNQTSETFTTEINEFMSLIDVWPFNPQFAELEDKRRIVAAQAVMVCSNFAFPQITNVGHVKPGAFDRRRHLLFKAYIPESVVEVIRTEFGKDIKIKMDNVMVPAAGMIPKEFFAKYGTYSHLRFSRHPNGTEFNTMEEELDFDAFITLAKAQAKEHREKELAFCQRTKAMYDRLSPEAWSERVNLLPQSLDGVPGTSAEPRADIEEAGHGLYHIFEDLGDARTTFTEVAYRHRSQKPIEARELECGCCYLVSNTGMLVIFENCMHNSFKRPEAEDATFDEEKVVHLGYDEKGDPSCPAVLWHGHIPTYAELKAHKRIPWSIRASWRSIPPPFLKWEEVCDHCCHTRSILTRAYFEVVLGKPELVVQASDGLLYVLPSYCVLRRTESVKFIGSAEEMEPHYGRFAPWGEWPYMDRHTMFRPFVCENTKTNPTFTFSGEVLKILHDGRELSISDPRSIVIRLNQLMTGTHYDDLPRPADSYSVARTFCCYRNEVKSPKWEGFKTFAIEITGIITAILLALWVIMGVVALYKTWKSGGVGAIPQAAYGGPNVPRVQNTSTVPLTSVVSAVPRGQENVVIRLLSENTCTIRKGTCTVEAIRLCSNFLLAPLHCMATPGKLTIFWRGSNVEVDDKNIEMVPFKSVGGGVTSDMCVFKVACLSASKNIMGHIITEKEVNVIKSKSELVQITEEGPKVSDVYIMPFSGTLNYGKSSIGATAHVTGFSWEGSTLGVRCGATVMSNSRIVGMYIADDRSSGVGYAVGITRELLNQGLQLLGATAFDMRVHRQMIVTPGTSKIPAGQNMVPLSVIQKPITYSGKTAIVPGPNTDKFSGPYLFPAEQRGSWPTPGDEVVCTKAYAQARPKDIEPGVHNIVKTFFLQFFLSFGPILTTKIPLSIEQAVCGLTGMVDFPSMNLNSSLGWPLKDLFPNGTKKKNVISLDPPEMEEKTLAFYNERNALRAEGVIPDGAFMDFPKDETLKPGKATRLINGSCLDHFIDMRRYVWHFFVAMRNKTGICVGMNVHSSQWGETLLDVDNPVDEDYSNYGLTIHSQIIEAIRDLAIEWHKKYCSYTEKDLNVVYCLFEEVRSSVHVLSDLKYQVLCGSPSGAFGTDMINSLSNMYYNMYSHFKKFGNFNRWSEEKILVYGDDIRRNQIRSHDEFKSHLNEIGMVIDKDKNKKGAFLKRYVNMYEFEEGEWIALAPLPPHVLVDMMHWIRKPYFSETEAFDQRMNSFISELFHYGKTTYVETIRKLSTIVDLSRCVIPNYEEYLANYTPLDFSTKVINLMLIDIDVAHTDLSDRLLTSKTFASKDEFDAYVLG